MEIIGPLPELQFKEEKLLPELNCPGIFLTSTKGKWMADHRLLKIFQNIKEILCGSNYYIYVPKKVLHVTNTEDMIPHLMGLQYVGKPGMFTGDRGVYILKKERITYEGVQKLVQKYYRKAEKQTSMLGMIYGKMNNLHQIESMLSNHSELYLYDTSANPELELKTDYLLVNQKEDMVLQLGLVKAGEKKSTDYHCNSFMVDYKANDNYDLHYKNLNVSYEISKIVKEDKKTGSMEVIYQSKEAEIREMSGIVKMLEAANLSIDEKLVKAIYRLNVKFGCYHTIEMLQDADSLLDKCTDKREEALVKAFMKKIEY